MDSQATAIDVSYETASHTREAVLENRSRVHRLFEQGATGTQVSAAMADGVQRLLRELLEETLTTFDERTRTLITGHAALVAVGGTGRGDMAPFSDVDLLFLYEPPASAGFQECASRFVRTCWDARLELGHAVRTPGETLRLARQEIDVATALVEARLLWGNERLFDQFRRRFERSVSGLHRNGFVDRCIESRREERSRYGAGVGNLSPDVKRSFGGLRDVHLLRWIGFARFGVTDLDALRLCGAISRADARAVRDAYDYLSRIRADLHFHAEREADLLSRDQQLRIADERGIEPPAGQEPVERFMQQFFRHAGNVADVCERFVSRHQPPRFARRIVDGLLTHRLDGDLRVGPQFVDVVPSARARVCGTLEGVLGVYRAAALHGVVPGPALSEAIREHLPETPRRLSARAARSVLEILRCRSSLGPVVRSMFATGVLERVLPDLARVQGLIQFSQYHSYTVDEHTLRAIETVTALEEDEGDLGAAYRALHHPEILHLALLLHDLGKGLPEDHSEVGRGIAERTADRLQLPQHHRETLVFLVHEHLLMAHLAFRRNVHDPEILLRFAHDVGTAETLRMLYALSAADLQAVGPGIWTDWKADLLHALYRPALQALSGRAFPANEQEWMEDVKADVVERLVRRNPESSADDVRRFLDAFPPHYLAGAEADDVAQDLAVLRALSPGEVDVRGRYDEGAHVVEYRVYSNGEDVPGYFYRTTGVLTANGMDILDAQISTGAGDLVVDTYRVMDNDHAEAIPEWRLQYVCNAVREALRPDFDFERLFQRSTRFGQTQDDEPVAKLPPRVVIDNDSSDAFTVVDVFAHDRRGLLFTIARTIFELGLSVWLAKISTHLDQVVDVFYVTDENRRKIRDGQRLHAVRERLAQTIDDFERDGHRRFAG